MKSGHTRRRSIGTAPGSYEASYGYVWYPTVSVGWRPYYHGRWATLRPYGWTWIGADPWAWPTHHYGRWGFSAGAWFWIPGRSWAPAWVSWAYAPGYVSWCPLGWNNRPIFSVNIYRGSDTTPGARGRSCRGIISVTATSTPGWSTETGSTRARAGRSSRRTRRRRPRVRRAARVRADSCRRHPRRPARDVPGLHEPGARGLARRLRAVTHDGRAVQKLGGGASPGRSRAVPRGSAPEFGVPAAGADSSGVPPHDRAPCLARVATEFGVPAASADSAARTYRAPCLAAVRPIPAVRPAYRFAIAQRVQRCRRPRPRRRARIGTRRPIAVRGPVPRADSAYRGSVSHVAAPAGPDASSGSTRRQARGLCRDPARALRPTTAAIASRAAGHRSPIAVPSRAMPRSAPESSRPSAPEYRVRVPPAAPAAMRPAAHPAPSLRAARSRWQPVAVRASTWPNSDR